MSAEPVLVEDAREVGALSCAAVDRVDGDVVLRRERIVVPPARCEVLGLVDAAKSIKVDPSKLRPLLLPGGPLHCVIFDPFGDFPSVIRISRLAWLRVLACPEAFGLNTKRPAKTVEDAEVAA